MEEQQQKKGVKKKHEPNSFKKGYSVQNKKNVPEQERDIFKKKDTSGKLRKDFLE